MQNLTKEQYDAHFANMRRIAKDEGIDYILKKYDVDVIIGPSDGFLQSMAACSGKSPSLYSTAIVDVLEAIP
jgi:amidase